MSAYEISVSTDSNPEHASVLLDRLSAFNRQIVPDLTYISDALPCFVSAVDTEGKFIGGISGRCYWNTLHIDLLWLDDAWRSKGTGEALLKSCEQFGLDVDCINASVETMSWQAKPFYVRNGYTVLGEITDRPLGHTTYYLHKRLSP